MCLGGAQVAAGAAAPRGAAPRWWCFGAAAACVGIHSASPPACCRPQQQFPSLRGHRAARNVRTTDAAAAASVGSGWMDMPESQPLPDAVEVFPRLKERDPYK